MRTTQFAPSIVIACIAGVTSGCITDIVPLDDSVPKAESSETLLLIGRINIHRSFNHSTGEHFYNTDPNEAVAAGFTIETLNYYGLGTSFAQNNVPFYRCFWQSAGKHLYTVQANCEISDARNEGQLGFISTVQQSGTVPLFRLRNPSNNDHFYTISSQERSLAILNVGYRDEGISGYVLPTASQWYPSESSLSAPPNRLATREGHPWNGDFYTGPVSQDPRSGDVTFVTYLAREGVEMPSIPDHVGEE